MGKKVYPVVDFPHQLTIIFKGVFHYKYLYMSAYDWICENGWVSYTGDNKVERLYAEEHLPGPIRKIWIWWRMQKDAGNSYYRYFMNVNWLGFGVSNVEIVKDGKKIKCQKGEINVIIKPWIELDWKDGWKNHPILKNFNDLYQKRIIKEDIYKRQNGLLEEAYRFHGMLKKTLELYHFVDDRELYGPEYALNE